MSLTATLLETSHLITLLIDIQRVFKNLAHFDPIDAMRSYCLRRWPVAKRCQCPNKWVIAQRGIEPLQDKLELVQCTPDSIESWQCNIAKPRSNSTKLTRHAWGSICSNWNDSAPLIRDKVSKCFGGKVMHEFSSMTVAHWDAAWPSNASSKVYHSRKQRESLHLDMRCRSCFRHQGQWRKPRTVLALKRLSVNLLHKRLEQSCLLFVVICIQSRKGRECPSCLA